MRKNYKNTSKIAIKKESMKTKPLILWELNYKILKKQWCF